MEVRMKTNVAIDEVRKELFTDTLRWLQLGAPHGVVGKLNDVGFCMSEIVNTSAENGGMKPVDWDGNECGAVCCMLGHVRLTKPLYVYESLMRQKTGTCCIALGLQKLFFPMTEELNKGLPASRFRGMGEVTPAWAAEVLHNYIQVGEVNWKLGRPA